jgi:hypothetical protein
MRILSGIQPSGVLHIGNFFGMMQPAIALQAEGEALYFIADYHALTSLRDPAALRENSRRVALDFLACGLDPRRAALFRQSDVPQVTELAWILSTVAPMSLLERAHSYKDKVARGIAASVRFRARKPGRAFRHAINNWHTGLQSASQKMPAERKVSPRDDQPHRSRENDQDNEQRANEHSCFSAHPVPGLASLTKNVKDGVDLPQRSRRSQRRLCFKRAAKDCYWSPSQNFA